jgi:hypothetical protein
MDVPGADNQAWKDIVTGTRKFTFDFLAAKIFMGRVMLRLQSDSSPEMVSKCAGELREVFAKNAQLPMVQQDIKKIFG